MKISIIGTGAVGQTLASKLITLDHEVMLSTRNVTSKLANTLKDAYGNPPLREGHKANSRVKIGSFAEVAAYGEIVLNATQGGNSINAFKQAHHWIYFA